MSRLSVRQDIALTEEEKRRQEMLRQMAANGTLQGLSGDQIERLLDTSMAAVDNAARRTQRHIQQGRSRYEQEVQDLEQQQPQTPVQPSQELYGQRQPQPDVQTQSPVGRSQPDVQPTSDGRGYTIGVGGYDRATRHRRREDPGARRIEEYFAELDRKDPRGRRFRRRYRAETEGEIRYLMATNEEWEEQRGQLNNMYERLDSPARAQVDELNKRADAVAKAFDDGRLTRLEYFRAVDVINRQAQGYKWKYHQIAPGGQVGDVIEQDGIRKRRTKDGDLEPFAYSPDYIRENVVDLGNGRMAVPVAPNRPMHIVDKDLWTGEAKRQEMLEKEQRNNERYYEMAGRAMSDMPSTLNMDAAERRQLQMQMARQIKKDMEELDSMESMDEASARKAQEQDAAAAEQQAMGEEQARADAAVDRSLINRQVHMQQEAQQPISKNTQKRVDEVNAMLAKPLLDRYSAESEAWSQTPYGQWEMNRMFQGPAAGPPPEGPQGAPYPKMPKKDELPQVEDVYGGKQSPVNALRQVRTENLPQAIQMLRDSDPVFNFMMDNPVSFDPGKGDKKSQMKPGIVYAGVDPKRGTTIKFIKVGGKIFELKDAPEDGDLIRQALDDQTQTPMRGHGNVAANIAAGGNL